MIIGLALRKLRDSRKISTRAIAERAGVSHSTYVDWERDKSSPSLKHFSRLARAFDMDSVNLMAYLTVETNQISTSKSTSDMREILDGLQRHLFYFQAWYDAVNLESEPNKIEEV